MTVWIYTDTNKQFSDVDHLKVFESVDAANEWCKVNDPPASVVGSFALP